MIYFITGNTNKFEEAKSILPEVEQLEMELPEIQEIDAHEIIKAKIVEALKYKEGEFIVEDTSLYLDCLNGLPGPLIKWFLKTIGNEGLVEITKKLGNNVATARTIIGYAKNVSEVYFFDGEIKGRIVEISGETKFGWDPIFQPDGYDQTFEQMNKEEKNKISMRRKAFDKLRAFLTSGK